MMIGPASGLEVGIALPVNACWKVLLGDSLKEAGRSYGGGYCTECLRWSCTGFETYVFVVE